MRKWMFAVSLLLVAFVTNSFASPKVVREKTRVIIVTSELSFIKYDGTFYMCDNDTPAQVTELASKCIEVSEAAFNYALNTTDADVMEMQMNVEKKVETPAEPKNQPAAKPPTKSSPASTVPASIKPMKSSAPAQKAGQSATSLPTQSKSSTKKLRDSTN